VKSDGFPRLMNAGQLAEHLSLPETWVREQARIGELPSIKLGHYVRFRLEDVKRYIAESTSITPVPSQKTAGNRRSRIDLNPVSSYHQPFGTSGSQPAWSEETPRSKFTKIWRRSDDITNNGALAASVRCIPVLRPFYQRLRASGKPAKVALVAAMHKLLLILNAMLKTKTVWRPPCPAA
jgi:excisionase family DNA binding protein